MPVSGSPVDEDGVGTAADWTTRTATGGVAPRPQPLKLVDEVREDLADGVGRRAEPRV